MSSEETEPDPVAFQAFLRERGFEIPTLFIDSNVVNEITTTVDLTRESRTFRRTRGLVRAKAEERKRRAHGSLWLMLALDSLATVSLSLQEPIRFLKKHAAQPATWGSEWTLAFFEFVRPHVAPNWTSLAWPEESNG